MEDDNIEKEEVAESKEENLVESLFRDKDGNKTSFNVSDIPWRKLIDPKFTYVNEQYFKDRNLELPVDKEGVDDDGLIVRLSGLKDLAIKHGYSLIQYKNISTDSENAVCKCFICWYPTAYNGYKYVRTVGIASANRDNLTTSALKYKESIASNRAFSRAVRDYFGIFSVSEEELDKTIPEKISSDIYQPNGSISPKDLRSPLLLEKAAVDVFGVKSFSEFKEKLPSFILDDEILEESKAWESYKDISSDRCKKLRKLIKDSKKEKCQNEK